MQAKIQQILSAQKIDCNAIQKITPGKVLLAQFINKYREDSVVLEQKLNQFSNLKQAFLAIDTEEIIALVRIVNDT